MTTKTVWVVSRPMDCGKREILARFDTEAEAKAYQHPVYKTSITTWEVPLEKRILRELAVTDLSYRLAEVVDDTKVKHYVLKHHLFNIIGSTAEQAHKRLLNIVKNKLGEDVEILPTAPADNSGPALKTEDLTSRMSPGAQTLLKPKIHNLVAEYNEERPVHIGRFKKIERALKKLAIYVMWGRVYKNPGGWATYLISRRYLLPTRYFYRTLDRWTNEIYTRKISVMLNLSVTSTEENLQHAIDRLSDIIEFRLGEQVIGSITGMIAVKLADTVGDGRTRYAVWAGVHVKSGLADAINTMAYARTKPKMLQDFMDQHSITNENSIGNTIPEDPKIEIITEEVV